MRQQLPTVIRVWLWLLALAILPNLTKAQTPTDLFFSEYIEGSSNNKALEIYNGTGAPIDLAAGQYVIQMYFNGNTTVGTTISLTGTVAAGGVYVVAASSAATSITAVANQLSSASFYNGDDAIVLRKGGASGTIVDVIGQVGFDPGTEWGTGLVSTGDNTIRRKATVCGGDTNPSDVFDPSGQWDGYANDTFDGLGTHTANCGGTGGGLPVVSITASDNAGSEAGSDPIVFVITRTGSTGAPLDVNYTVGGTATNGTDYTPALTGTATLPAGQASLTITLTPVDDALVENSETATLTLASSANYTLGTSTATATIADNDVAPSTTRIRDIQGAAHTSPLVGTSVTSIPGIVTGLRSNGFYLQDATSDNDDRTSEGIFVFTSAAPTAPIGASVVVSGTVAEFRPSGSANNLTTTQIQSPTVTILSTGNSLPTPVVLGNGGRAIPNTIIEDQTGNVETGGLTFDPATDGIDFYESLEGMLVQINNPLTVSPTATSGGAAGELWVVADNGANATIKSARGGVILSANDQNPERIQLDDNLLGPASGTYLTPTVNVGAQLSTVVGIVNWTSGNYEVLMTALPTVLANPLTKESSTLAPETNKLTVATFNVENLSPNDSQTKFNNLAGRIANSLRSPDILLLEEIQDNNGATNDAVVDADVTFNLLISAIAAAGGPTYQFRQINPVDDQDGGQAGGNIRVGFLFNPNRVSFTDRPGGTSTAATTVNTVNGQPQLSFNPGRVDPTNAAFTNYDGSGPASNSRKPLAGEFVFNGQTVFVIGNHFSSKIPDDILFGVNQPAALLSEPQRVLQATVVRNFVQNILAVNPNANVVVLGDLNDFEFSNPVNVLKQAPLNALIETLPANERYTYNFEGNSQAIDHILVTNNLLGKLDQYDVVHINSEFVEQDSDHDPSVARFTLTPPVAATLTGSTTICAGGTATLVASVTGGTGPYQVVLSVGNSTTTISNYTSGSPIVVAPTEPTVYSLVSVTDAAGSASSSLSGTATVAVNSATATVTGTLTVCEGQSTVLTASGGDTYLWSTNATSATVSVGAGTYSVTVTAANTCTATASVSVAAVARPAAPSLTGASLTVLTSATPLLLTNFVTATSGNTLTFSGSIGVINPPVANISTPGVQTFSVVQTNPAGCVSAATVISLTVISPQPPSSQTICRGTSLVLSVDPLAGTRFQWLRGGQSAAHRLIDVAVLQRGTTTASLTLVSAQSSATYYCQVTQANGTVRVLGPFVVTVQNCHAGRMAADEPTDAPVQIRLLSNPLEGGRLRAVVTGAAGQRLRVELLTQQGRVLTEQHWTAAAAEQSIDWDVSQQAAGLLLLRATTDQQSQTVKVLHQ